MRNLQTLSDGEVTRRAVAAGNKSYYLLLHLLNISYTHVGGGCRIHTAEKHDRLKRAADRLDAYANACLVELDRRDGEDGQIVG